MVIAGYVWGPQWCKRHVLFRSDNGAVVHMLNSTDCKIACLIVYCAICCFPLLVKVFPFQSNIFQVLTTNSLMLSLASIGRNFDSWHQMLNPSQRPTAVGGVDIPSLEQQCPHLLETGSCPLYSQVLRFSSEEVYHVLSPAGQAPSFCFSLPYR